jgi:hypothetical protein
MEEMGFTRFRKISHPRVSVLDGKIVIRELPGFFTKEARSIQRFTEKNLLCVPQCTPCLRGYFFKAFFSRI